MNCNYKVKIKDIQNKYQFKIFCKTYDDTEIQEDIDTLEDDVEALQKENAYLNNLVEQAFDKKEVEGEELSINDTIEAKMNVSLYGNTKQETTTGKNLVNETQKGYWNNNGEFDNDITFGSTKQIKVVEGNTYVGSFFDKNKKYVGKLVYTIFDENKNFIRYSGDDTITIGKNEVYVSLRTYKNQSSYITSNNFLMQLEKGSTATPYEPYTNGASPNPDYPQEIQSVTGNNKVVVSNKNLANIEKFNIAGGTGITYPKTIQGLKENTEYIISFYKSRIAGATISNTAIHGCRQMHFYHNEEKLSEYIYDSPVSGFSSGNKKFEIKITTPAKCNKVICYFDNANGDNNINTTVYDIQLEEGSTATSYVPYKETIYELDLGNIELCKIGDYQDYFYKNNNKWYKREVIGSVTLDGSEDWRKSGKAGVTRYFQNTTPQSIKYTSGVTNNLLLVCSNYFFGITQNTSDNNGIGIAPFNSAGCLLNLSVDTSFDTVEKLKTFIADKKPIYKYVKAESTDIEITDTTLISQLEALKTAMSYTEQTNISQINDDIPFILKVTALASYNSRIVALENAILNANRSTQTKNARKSNEVIEEPKKEVVDDNKDENIIKEEE